MAKTRRLYGRESSIKADRLYDDYVVSYKKKRSWITLPRCETTVTRPGLPGRLARPEGNRPSPGNCETIESGCVGVRGFTVAVALLDTLVMLLLSLTARIALSGRGETLRSLRGSDITVDLRGRGLRRRIRRLSECSHVVRVTGRLNLRVGRTGIEGIAQ